MEVTSYLPDKGLISRMYPFKALNKKPSSYSNAKEHQHTILQIRNANGQQAYEKNPQ